MKIAALVTRDEKKALRWAKTLREARFPADAFGKLVPESEETAARLRGGELGWVDDTSVHLPESFRQASLALPRPGAVAGPLRAGGAYHVILCLDRVPARVKPFEEVAQEIRNTLLERRRGETVRARLESIRSTVKPVIDWQAVQAIPWDTAGTLP